MDKPILIFASTVSEEGVLVESAVSLFLCVFGLSHPNRTTRPTAKKQKSDVAFTEILL